MPVVVAAALVVAAAEAEVDAITPVVNWTVTPWRTALHQCHIKRGRIIPTHSLLTELVGDLSSLGVVLSGAGAADARGAGGDERLALAKAGLVVDGAAVKVGGGEAGQSAVYEKRSSKHQCPGRRSQMD